LTKKRRAAILLSLIAFVIVFAVVSFVRTNWGANQRPGAIESFIARFIRGLGVQSRADQPNPFTATPENLEEGRMHYEQQCVFCHGDDGRGQSPDAGIQFYPPVPSLVDSELTLSDGQMHSVVTNGIRYTAMPAFDKVLTPEETWKTVLWIRRLAQQPPPASPASSEPPPAGP
jgi:mono/diheme cytochrome c family protein